MLDFEHIGFGETPFINPTETDGAGDLAATITDLRMQQLSYALRSKPSWWAKFKDPTIREKWEAEAMAIDFGGQSFTKNEVQYVLDELEGYRKIRDDVTGIQESCYARIYESDALISEDLHLKLIDAARKLEDVPEAKMDWHPRSGQQVLDLIHPSLHCLVYGRTIGYPSGDAPQHGEPQAIHYAALPNEDETAHWAISEKFCWIPTDFDISADGQSAKAVSYINNLHPSHTDLYEAIEALVARFSLLLDRVLTDLNPNNGGVYRRITSGYTPREDNEEAPEYLPPAGDGDDRRAYDDEFSLRHEAWVRNRVLDPPTVPKGGYKYAKDVSTRFQTYSLRGRRVQVIVKLANIHLTPEKPDYPGGSWHVEGMANENIVASGIYYYDEDNITESRLAFRSAVCGGYDLPYEQDDEVQTMDTYGLDRSTPSNQIVGSVVTKAGRCIAFPNVYQHKVSSFSLSDKTKPGHRKILALFLVRPDKPPIHSTTQIPPQQADWAREAMATAHEDSPFTKLPEELLIMVSQNVETLMTEEEAKEYRLELMDERSVFVRASDEHHFEVPFNMCEH